MKLKEAITYCNQVKFYKFFHDNFRELFPNEELMLLCRIINDCIEKGENYYQEAHDNYVKLVMKFQSLQYSKSIEATPRNTKQQWKLLENIKQNEALHIEYQGKEYTIRLNDPAIEGASWSLWIDETKYPDRSPLCCNFKDLSEILAPGKVIFKNQIIM